MERDFHKTARIAQKDVDRALFWFEVKLWLKIALGVLLPTAVSIWLLIKFLDQMK